MEYILFEDVFINIVHVLHNLHNFNRRTYPIGKCASHRYVLGLSIIGTTSYQQWQLPYNGESRDHHHPHYLEHVMLPFFFHRQLQGWKWCVVLWSCDDNRIVESEFQEFEHCGFTRFDLHRWRHEIYATIWRFCECYCICNSFCHYFTFDVTCYHLFIFKYFRFHCENNTFIGWSNRISHLRLWNQLQTWNRICYFLWKFMWKWRILIDEVI